MTLTLPRLKWTPSPNYSSRGGQRVRLMVVHSTEGAEEGAIEWFAQARSQVSAHIVLSSDGSRATQMVAWANKAWACCLFNPVSENFEAAGFAAKGFADAEWDALASIVAFRLHANGLPCRWAEKGIGDGFCSHYDLGAAGGRHHDPTTDSTTWESFCHLVERAYAQEMPDAWRPDAAPAPAPRPAPQPNDGPPHGCHDLAYGTLEWVQASLNALKIPHNPLVVDGIEGPSTRAAIVDFQRHAHLFIDGEAGKDTCAALEKALG